MTSFLARVLSCCGAFAVCALLFPGTCTIWGVLAGGALLTVFYVFLRPVLQGLILPLNLFLAGLLTPLTDALLVLWACAWTGGTELSYWQSVCAALLAALFYLPYTRSKKAKLFQGGA